MDYLKMWVVLLFSQYQNLYSGVSVGGLATLIVYIIERLWGRTMNNAWYVLIFIFFFVVAASFLVWMNEYNTSKSLKKELDAFKYPQLSAQIDVPAWASAGDKKESCIVFITATIKNTGAQSIVNQIEASITVDNNIYKGEFSPLPPEIRIKGESNTIAFKGEDSLFVKGLARPIPTGGAVNGFICLFFRNLPNNKVNSKNTVVTLFFQDVADKNYSVEKRMTGQMSAFFNIETLNNKYKK